MRSAVPHGRGVVFAVGAVLSLLPVTRSAAQTAGARRPPVSIVRTYDAFRHHDPAQPEKTEAALAGNARVCGPTTGMFDQLRLDSSRDQAAAIVRAFDEARIEHVIEDASARAATVLAGPPMTVCVYAVERTKGIPHLKGVGGTSMGAGRIHLYLHPTEDRFASLPYAVAHEYYHEVERLTAPAISADEVLVSEGKADYFALQLYPHLRPPHTIPRTARELRIAWEAFQRYRRSDRPSFRTTFMIAVPPSTLPLWAGYKLGFEIVRQYLSTRRSRPESWAAIPASDMIAGFTLPVY